MIDCNYVKNHLDRMAHCTFEHHVCDKEFDKPCPYDLDNDDIVVTKVSFESNDVNYLDIAATRNEDGTAMATSISWDDLEITNDNIIISGDEFTFIAISSEFSKQVVIIRRGIEVKVDINNDGDVLDANETYYITNDKIMDLGSYKD